MQAKIKMPPIMEALKKTNKIISENNYNANPVRPFRYFKTIKDLLKDAKKRNHSYSFYKNELSAICGFEAALQNYNQSLYDSTLRKIVKLLGV